MLANTWIKASDVLPTAYIVKGFTLTLMSPSSKRLVELATRWSLSTFFLKLELQDALRTIDYEMRHEVLRLRVGIPIHPRPGRYRLDLHGRPARGLAQLADRIVDLHVLRHAGYAVVDRHKTART